MKRVSKLDQFSEIQKLIDQNLPEDQQRVQLCKILLEELKNLSPSDLADYLEFYGIDFIIPGVVIKLKFPVNAHIFNPDCADVNRMVCELENRVSALENQKFNIEPHIQAKMPNCAEDIANKIKEILLKQAENKCE